MTTTLVTHLVACLHRRDSKRSVPAALSARLVLFAAATGRSLSAVAQRGADAPSDEAARLALRFQLPATSLTVLDQLLHALHHFVPEPFRRGRPVGAALDLHLRPYYGDRHPPGTGGGKREAGTDRFWGYGTRVVWHRGLRLTVGLCPVDRRQSVVAVVRTLVGQAQQRGLRLKWLLLDRGFYDAQVVQWLQQARVPFVMPLIRRGDAARGTGTQPFFRRPAGWYDYSWTARPRGRDAASGRTRKQAALPVRIRVCVVERPARKPWVYACWGIAWDTALVRQRYRRRFGIETSYRQLGQSLARTTSTDERVRLLLVGLALLVRQYWVWVHYSLVATVAGNGHRRLHPERLPLADVVLWLHLTLATALRYRLEITNPDSPGT